MAKFTTISTVSAGINVDVLALGKQNQLRELSYFIISACVSSIQYFLHDSD